MKRTITKRGVTLKKAVLVRARKKLGLTQESLGLMVGSQQMTGWRAENRPIDIATAKKIAKAVKVPYSKLIDESKTV